jgi:hypothetical protein
LQHAENADAGRGERDARAQHGSILEDTVDNGRRKDADDRQVIAESTCPHGAGGVEPPNRAGVRERDQPVDGKPG